jgi:Cu+-exporting ATPase
MTVDPDRAAGHSEWHGETFHFCSRSCKAKFDADPERYAGEADHHDSGHEHAGHESHPAARDPAHGTAGRAERSPPAAGAAVYTCPMHPEIRQDHPGACPICGMALEPVTPTAEVEEDPELRDMTRRFWVSLALTAPLFVLAMAHLVLALAHVVAPGVRVWVELALATPVVLWGGWPFLVRGWNSVRTWNLNMFTLIALGVVAAYGYSVVATAAPGAFPASFRGMGGTVGVYYEAAAVIVTLVLLGSVSATVAARASCSVEVVRQG